MIKKIAFVGQPTKNLEAAKKFYGEILGLELDADYGDCWSEFKTPDGKAIALDTITPTKTDSPTTYLALETDHIEEEVERIQKLGGQIAQDVWENKDGEGRGICKMAIVLDPDGNALLLHEIAAWREKG
jgi:predicted enzyme related to lactoylglutathione lyase